MNAIDERAAVCGNTTLAVVVVDGQGRPVEGKTFLSSFAWDTVKYVSDNCGA